MSNPRTAYLETSFVSYLTGDPTRDLVTAAKQQSTREWWHQFRARFTLYTSEIVLREAEQGDPRAAAKRLQVLDSIESLDVTQEARELARHLMAETPLPEKAAVDALHIAIATVHGVDFLITWNCTHIANAQLLDPLRDACSASGYRIATICTPYEFLEED